MNPLLLKIVASIGLLLAIIGSTWFASKAHYVSQFVALKAEIQQQAKDEQINIDAINLKNNFVTKEAYNEAQTQLANASNTIGDLNKRMQQHPTIVTSQVSGTKGCTNQLNTNTDGPGTNSSTGQSPELEGPTTSSLDTETLRDVLSTGIDALNAELIWRKWNR